MFTKMMKQINSKVSMIIILTLFIGTMIFGFLSVKSPQPTLLTIFLQTVSTSTISSSLRASVLKPSRWKKDRLVVIPAIWKEIDWTNRPSWPSWLRDGLDFFNKNASRAYDVYLYQRMDPKSTAPYDWPYCYNVHEEAGVYLKFIYDYYHDLPDRMLFVHGAPYKHSPNPIEAAQCVHDDIYYVNINTLWIQGRRWTAWPRDPADNIAMMYKCAKRILDLLGFDGDAQLNPMNKLSKDENYISTLCCAQFFVRKERIHHYTYAQWSALYNASLLPYCTTERDREEPGKLGTKWFGGSFEHLWHVILGLQPTDMLPLRAKTNTDLCHLFRSSCKGSPCTK